MADRRPQMRAGDETSPVRILNQRPLERSSVGMFREIRNESSGHPLSMGLTQLTRLL